MVAVGDGDQGGERGRTPDPSGRGGGGREGPA